MNTIGNFFRGLVVRWTADKPEAGDGLTDDATTLVLSHLSSITWIVTYPQVCRKWNRLANNPVLWKSIAEKYDIVFPSDFNKQVTSAFKHQIYQRLNIEIPAKTKENFFDKIKLICSLMKPKEITGIHYRSVSNKDAYFKVFMVKGQSSVYQLYFQSLDPNPSSSHGRNDAFNELEKIARIYRIQGEEKADFSSDQPTNENSFGISEDNFDLEVVSVKINSLVSRELLKEIQNHLKT